MTLISNDSFDDILKENVRPASWDNQPKRDCYDYIAIGGGTAGLVATGAAAMLGAAVLLIERDLLGGDCLVTGCVPSKAIIKAAQRARESEAFGIATAPVTVAFSAVVAALRQTRSEISTDGSAKTVAERGIDVLYGNAKFTGTNSIEINGSTIQFKRAIVCAGGRAAIPDIPGLSEAIPLTNENLFILTELPHNDLELSAAVRSARVGQDRR